MTNLNKLQAPFERLKNYGIVPDVSLRKAIIMQAIFDASSIAKDRKAKKNRIEAITWLFGNSADFRQICFEADLCPDMVSRVAKEEIANARAIENKNFANELYKENVKIYDVGKLNKWY